MIGRPMLIEAEFFAQGVRILVEVRRSDFSRLPDGEWVEGDDEDLAVLGVAKPECVVAVVRNRVRAFWEDRNPLGRTGFFGDQDDVVRFLEREGARVVAAVEV